MTGHGTITLTPEEVQTALIEFVRKKLGGVCNALKMGELRKLDSTGAVLEIEYSKLGNSAFSKSFTKKVSLDAVDDDDDDE